MISGRKLSIRTLTAGAPLWSLVTPHLEPITDLGQDL